MRRISYAESLTFERVHAAEYRHPGFDLVDVPAGAVAERAAVIGGRIRSWVAGA